MKKAILILGLLIVLFIAGCSTEEAIKNTDEETTMKTATFETNQGTFKLELFTSTMPITTKNFIDLAEKGFYDGTRFHRVIPNFMVQGGDPLSKDKSKTSRWGTGGPGYDIKDEFTDSNKNDRGTISMANSGPNTGGSQFFLNVVNNNFLDDKHPVFGKVIEGMDIVDLIVSTPTAGQDRPVTDMIIEKLTIE